MLKKLSSCTETKKSWILLEPFVALGPFMFAVFIRKKTVWSLIFSDSNWMNFKLEVFFTSVGQTIRESVENWYGHTSEETNKLDQRLLHTHCIITMLLFWLEKRFSSKFCLLSAEVEKIYLRRTKNNPISTIDAEGFALHFDGGKNAELVFEIWEYGNLNSNS